MTQADWWAATEPDKLIDCLFFGEIASDRKLRLFSVAGCEPLRHLVNDSGVLGALDTAEAFADGLIDATALQAVHDSAWVSLRAKHDDDLAYGILRTEVANAEIVCLYPTAQDPHRDRDRYRQDEDAPYALLIALFIDHPRRTNAAFRRLLPLLHDIFGPLPFREVTIQPDWLTSNVTALARGIYDEKAFGRMPILADALQDAGCVNEEILSHCRNEDWEHVRGCWVLDLLMGRPWREE